MEDLISAKRSNLSPNSVKTYASNLRTLCRDLSYVGMLDDIMNTHSEKVLNYIYSLHPNRMKQVASAVLIFCPSNQELKDVIMSANKACFDIDEKQELTEAQKQNWLSWDQILEKRTKLYKLCIPLWVKLHLNSDEYEYLHNYVLSMVVTEIPPRRCLDYCFMKKDDTEVTNSDNYIESVDDQHYFVFNRYKTQKAYGQQRVEIPESLWEIIREWRTICVSPFLFHVSQTNPTCLRVDQFTRRLAKIFEQPGFGVNLLRHAYVSDEVLEKMPFISDLKHTAYKLGHSMKETMLYKKHVN